MKKIDPKYIPLLGTTVVMLLLYIGGCIGYHDRNFGSVRVLKDLLDDNAYIGVAAVGATFVIISGGIDLSVGSVVAFTGILIAQLINLGWPPALALLLSLLIGLVFGAAQGALIHAFALPPFLVTLGGMFFLRGLSFVVRTESLGIKHPFFLQTLPKLAIPLTRHPQVSLPFTATCFIVVIIAATALSVYTRFGRNVYALGSSENSAILMGLPVGRTKIGIYALAGFFSALSGCLATFYKLSGDPAGFVGMELDAIASVAIGGTLLTGGVGFIPGTMMGVLILGLIQVLISFEGSLNSWWTRIAVGVLLLLFIGLQKIVGARRR